MAYVYILNQHNYRLSNEKPSAIFRLRGAFTVDSTSSQNAFSSAMQAAPTTVDVTAILGFSLEPLEQIQNQISSMPASSSAANAHLNAGGAISKPGPDATLLAERIAKNLFNFVSGFAPGGGVGMVTADTVVPMGVIAKWYEKFLSKVKAGGVAFLESEE